MQKLVNISKSQISSKGVQSLADRPNANAQYGVGGLSSTQLKLWFDNLATFLAEKINEIHSTLSSDECADYIRVVLDDYDIFSLDDFISSIKGDAFCDKVLRLYPSANSEDKQSLQTIVSVFAKNIAINAENISKVSTFDLIITLSDLDAGKTINELLATARGRVLVHLLGGDMPYYCNQRYGTGEDITVPNSVTYIEFACDLPFEGSITGAGTGCQVIRGANSYSYNLAITGFLGGVEHCHGQGWRLENCVNISHCYITTMTDCSNISDCSRVKEINEVSSFTNCKFINNFMIKGYAVYKFNNCSYLRNIECSAGTLTYQNCLYVDAHTCAGFLATEDVGKVQALTADGSFATVPYAKGVSF